MFLAIQIMRPENWFQRLKKRTLDTGLSQGAAALEILLRSRTSSCVRDSGAPNDSFLPHSLKTLFRISRVYFGLQKCILSGAIKFVSVRSSQGNLSMSLSEITRASVLFSLKFRRNLAHQDKDIFFIPLAITFLHLKILGFLFPTKSSLTWGEMSKN